MKRVHFAHFPVAGFSYYEGVLAFDALKIGGLVQLKPDPGNHYDKYAVEIYHEDHKLGFIPRGENRNQLAIAGMGITHELGFRKFIVLRRRSGRCFR